ncbi:hypothetical protein [Natronolimnobius baerhuensis]|uniref:Uncharacterized protein n=1 Tax=Natronolimnobius baerhuensis TaxID=253108 RepID=A0A202E6S2_9EURY|nr:hypothetical protein [Natronolimnobius baerhuensis]OVE83937.1 hypothetical protein B2G88_16125 [Natronolimnobius baerhuensis]
MLTRENLVILGSLALLFALLLVGLPLLEDATGLSINDYPLPAFLLFVGLAIVLPQLSLARTDAEASPRTRIRFAVIATGLFALLFTGGTYPEAALEAPLENLESLQGLVILVIGAGAFLGLVGYEFVAGFGSQSSDGDSSA